MRTCPARATEMEKNGCPGGRALFLETEAGVTGGWPKAWGCHTSGVWFDLPLTLKECDLVSVFVLF